jgi:hypothetical protein
MKVISILALFVFVTTAVFSQTAATTERARVFVSDSQSWQVTGSSGGSSAGFGSHTSGGARPQTAEIIKTFGERCPEVVVNNKADRADYVILLDHEGGKGYALKDNKVAVFNSDGDSILSHSTRSLGNAVKDACEAIAKDWPTRAKVVSSKEAALKTVSSNTSTDSSAAGKLAITSTPTGADIEVDGSFVGNTPSIIEVPLGDHSVAIRKAGYRPWERKMKISGGSVNLSAELDKQ